MEGENGQSRLLIRSERAGRPRLTAQSSNLLMSMVCTMSLRGDGVARGCEGSRRFPRRRYRFIPITRDHTGGLGMLMSAAWDQSASSDNV